jgi:hypothetical protein
MSKIPEIRIYYGYLLEREGYKLVDEPKHQSWEQYQTWVTNYRRAWSPYEAKILSALQGALGVNFCRTVIDVPCAPYFTSKSDPLIMNFSDNPDEFVDDLAHELCHVLLTDNHKIQDKGTDPDASLMTIWSKLFGEYDVGTLVHIPVHALMKHIYLDVLGEPARLERDLERSQRIGPAYVESWQHVQDGDYQTVIAKLKDSYAGMRA